jgi:acetyl esterase
MTVEADGVEARVRIVKPVGATGLLPAVLYLHGGGWVLGSAATHDRTFRKLCGRAPKSSARHAVSVASPLV